MGKVNQVNNSVIFSRKPIESKEFLALMVYILGIVIDDILIKDLVKWKVKPMKKIECVAPL